MKLRVALLLGLLSALAMGQQNALVVQQQFSAAGTSAWLPVAGYTNFTLTWSQVGATSVTGCQVQVDSSPVGSGGGTAGGLISSQSCNTNGTVTVASESASFSRINVTGITAGTIKITYSAVNGALSKGGSGSYTGSSPIVVSGNTISCPTCGTSLATVESFSTGSWLSWLTPSVTNSTTTPVLALAAATGQTSHEVIGTCGTATAFAPCALVAADLPSIPFTQISGTPSTTQVPVQSITTAGSSGPATLSAGVLNIPQYSGGGGGGIPYPGAGIPVSVLGTSWGTSLTEFGSEAGLATAADPGATLNVPMVADGSHGIKPSPSGALNTGAFAAVPTATSITTLLQGLTGCNTASYVYTPQASDCVAQTGGANTALSNLATVAINTSLLPASSGSANIGNATLPFGTGFFNTQVDVSTSGIFSFGNPADAQMSYYSAGLLGSPGIAFGAGSVVGDYSAGVVATVFCLTPAHCITSWPSGGGNFSATITSPVASQTLQYNGTAWVNVTPGVPVDTSNTAIIPASDNASLIASSTLTTLAGTNILTNGFVFAYLNLNSTSVTYTPLSGVVYPGGGAVQQVPSNAFCFVYTNGTNTYMPCMPTLAAFNPITPFTTNSLLFASSPTAAGTANYVTVNGSSDLTLGLTGSHTGNVNWLGSTSGTFAVNVNSTATQLNLGLNANVTSAGALTVTSCTGCGASSGVSSVSAVAPVVSSGGTTPSISLQNATPANVTTVYGTQTSIATSGDPGAIVGVPAVSNGSHGWQASAGGALGTGAFTTAYVLPAATSSTLGGVKPDGTSILNTAGAISATAASVGAEPALGNPGTNGYVLSSTTAGTRSWIAPAGDTITSPNSTLNVGGTTSATTLDIAGAAGEIMAGATPALTYTPALGKSGTAGTLSLFPATGNFTTTLGSAATASNTVNFFASVPTTLHTFYCVVSSTTCTLTDSGYAYNSIPFADLSGVAPSFGSVTQYGIAYGSSSTAVSTTGALTANALIKAGSSAAPSASSVIDNGTNVTTSDTGGFVGPVFTANGSTAGFIDLPQGSTSAAVAPCNTANSHCIQAGTAVTAGVETDAPALAQGIPTRTGSSSAVTDGYSGDANHSATVSWSTATSVGSTSLCSSANCPAGTYRVSAYMDVTTACSTTGSYVVNLIWTDDTTVSKTSVIPLVGLGVTPTFGPTAITATLVPTSTTDFGTGSFILRSTGTTSINYSTTAGACGTGGPGVGKLYLTVEPIQ